MPGLFTHFFTSGSPTYSSLPTRDNDEEPVPEQQGLLAGKKRSHDGKGDYGAISQSDEDATNQSAQSVNPTPTPEVKVRTTMTRAEALDLLQLRGTPWRGDIRKACEAARARYRSFGDESDPQYEELFVAMMWLNVQQTKLLEKFGAALDQRALQSNTELEKHGSYVSPRVLELGQKYLKNLADVNADVVALEAAYERDYKRLLSSALLTIHPEDRGAVIKAIEELYVNIAERAQYLDSEAKQFSKNVGELNYSQALKILGLKGFVFNADIIAAFEEVSQKYHPENGGSPRRYAECVAAARCLKNNQMDFLAGLQEQFDQCYKKYQRLSTPLDFSESDQQSCEELFRLSQAHIDALIQPDADVPSLTKAYQDNYTRVLSQLSEGARKEFLASFPSVYIDIKHSGYIFVSLLAENPIALLQQRHDEYVQDLTALSAEFPEKNAVFDQLTIEIQEIGDRYYAEIQKPGANVEALKKNYVTEFNAAVMKAKLQFAFSEELWGGMRSVLKELATQTFVSSVLLSMVESKLSNPNRMFQLKSHDILKQWQQWDLDTLPQIDASQSLDHP